MKAKDGCYWQKAVFGIGFEVILKKGRRVRSFADKIWQKFNPSTSVALVGCSAILLRAEGQQFVPPLGLSPANGEFPDPTSGCGSGLSGYESEASLN